jgi:hypothetical protein
MAGARGLGGHPGHGYAPTLGAAVEGEAGLVLPPAQDLLLPGTIGVVENEGGARGKEVCENRQGGVAGQAVAGGMSGRAVHQQQVDRISS